MTEDDVFRAIKKVKVLGSGLAFDIVVIGKRQYIRSVPGELNMDSNKILELAQVTAASLSLGLFSSRSDEKDSLACAGPGVRDTEIGYAAAGVDCGEDRRGHRGHAEAGPGHGGRSGARRREALLVPLPVVLEPTGLI